MGIIVGVGGGRTDDNEILPIFAQIVKLLSIHTGVAMEDVTKSGKGSKMVLGRIGEP